MSRPKEKNPQQLGQSRLLLTRRDFVRIAGLAGVGMIFAPAINRMARAVEKSVKRTTSDWPPETLVWQQDPALGISQYTAWEFGYDDDPFPNMMEFKDDPKGIFPHRGLWCNIPQDLALEDWDSYREQLLGEENIVLNDWIIMWEDNRNGKDNARIYIENHIDDMQGVPVDPQDREDFLDFWAEVTTYQKARVYPSPMKDFVEPVPLPCRLEVDFWLGDDWVKTNSTPKSGWPAITNVLSVFDYNIGTYYPIALVDLLGPLDGISLFCRSSGDLRPGKNIPGAETILELTDEGQTRPISLNSKISLRCDLWPGSGRDFLVYVRDEIYDPDFVLYAQGQYSEAAYPQVVSTHSGLYTGWQDEPDGKLIKGSFFLGGYRIWSDPDAELPTETPDFTSTVKYSPTPSPSSTPPPPAPRSYIPFVQNLDEQE